MEDVVLSQSKMRTFMECETLYYHNYIAKDIISPPSAAMSVGKLLDAIITKNYLVLPDGKPNIDVLKSHMATKYSDGSADVDNLLLKSGMLSAAARKVVSAGIRLRGDPVFKELIDKAKFQVDLEGEICGVTFQGTADIITEYRGETYIIDVKKTSVDPYVWAPDANGRSVKLPWWDGWDYWMQLTAYWHMLGNPNAKCAVIGVSEEDIPRMEYVGLTPMFRDLEEAWEPYIGRMMDYYSNGWDKVGRCGNCIACKYTSSIKVTDPIVPYNRHKL